MLTWTDKRAALLAVLATGRKTANAEVRARQCPFCLSTTKEPFQINAETGFYHCFSCAASGVCPGFHPDVRVPELCTTKRDKTARYVDPPEDYQPFRDVRNALKYSEAVRYVVRKRRIPLPVAIAHGMGCCTTGRYANRVILPVYDAADPAGWLGWVGRTYRTARFPYTTPTDMDRAIVLYQRWHLDVETDKPLVVVEGVFDAVYVGMGEMDAVAVFGKISEPQFKMFLAAKRPIALCFDGDARHHGLFMAHRLRMHGKSAGSIRLRSKTDPDEYGHTAIDRAALECITAPSGEAVL